MSAYRAHRSASLYSPPYHLSPLAFLLAPAPRPTLPPRSPPPALAPRPPSPPPPAELAVVSLLVRLHLYSMPCAAMAEAEALRRHRRRTHAMGARISIARRRRTRPWGRLMTRRAGSRGSPVTSLAVMETKGVRGVHCEARRVVGGARGAETVLVARGIERIGWGLGESTGGLELLLGGSNGGHVTRRCKRVRKGGSERFGRCARARLSCGEAPPRSGPFPALRVDDCERRTAWSRGKGMRGGRRRRAQREGGQGGLGAKAAKCYPKR